MKNIAKYDNIIMGGMAIEDEQALGCPKSDCNLWDANTDSLQVIDNLKHISKSYKLRKNPSGQI